jgi:hypothetical protein
MLSDLDSRTVRTALVGAGVFQENVMRVKDQKLRKEAARRAR